MPVIEAIDHILPTGDKAPPELAVVEAEVERQRRALEQATTASGIPAVREQAARGEVASFVLGAIGRR